MCTKLQLATPLFWHYSFNLAKYNKALTLSIRKKLIWHTQVKYTIKI